jgi:hopanoid C-2 methylase
VSDEGDSAQATSAGRTRYRPLNKRNILCVFPAYAPSFGTFQHAYKLFPDVSAFMPPQGLLLIAAYLPAEWDVRFIDENQCPAGDGDFAWADAVLMSGMHVQRGRIDDINRRAHRHSKLTVLGGPSVSASPDYYPEVDILHLGEMGDGTDALIACLDGQTARPPRQLVFATDARLDMTALPLPAYERIDLRNYFLGSVQFSSGCPYLCEFCDIPALYGRRPRMKEPEQICRELDAMVARGARSGVYFVDDNFVANKAAALRLLPNLIRWQERNGFPINFNCEATLNIAQMPELLAMMRAAKFITAFVGIETPEANALLAMKKKQNLRLPILEAVDELNRHGMEVVSGIIMGLDTDTPDTGRHILDFVAASNIPVLTMNLLYALPKTPLYGRLARVGRLLSDRAAANRVSNVEFLMPYEEVIGMWLETITAAYEPAALFGRFRHQTEHTYPNRLQRRPQPSAALVRYGLSVICRVLWHCGLRAPWRRQFWDLCWPLIRQGRIDEAIQIGAVTHHLLTFSQEIAEGRWEASFYADPNRAATAGSGLLSAHPAAAQ